MPEAQKRKIGLSLLGLKRSDETKKKMSLSKLGIKNPQFEKIGDKNQNWKGDIAGYGPIHIWLRKNFGKPDHCDICNRVKPPKGKGEEKNYFHWSDKTGTLDRDLSNWWQLCNSCHEKYDRGFLGKKFPFKGKICQIQ